MRAFILLILAAAAIVLVKLFLPASFYTLTALILALLAVSLLVFRRRR